MGSAFQIAFELGHEKVVEKIYKHILIKFRENGNNISKSATKVIQSEFDMKFYGQEALKKQKEFISQMTTDEENNTNTDLEEILALEGFNNLINDTDIDKMIQMYPNKLLERSIMLNKEVQETKSNAFFIPLIKLFFQISNSIRDEEKSKLY